MPALVDLLYLYNLPELPSREGGAAAASLDGWLDEMTALLTDLAYRRDLPQAKRNEAPPERAPAMIAGCLRRYLPECSEAQLLNTSRLLVYAADGILEGALRRKDVSARETRTGLLAAWTGILSEGARRS